MHTLTSSLVTKVSSRSLPKSSSLVASIVSSTVSTNISSSSSSSSSSSPIAILPRLPSIPFLKSGFTSSHAYHTVSASTLTSNTVTSSLFRSSSPLSSVASRKYDASSLSTRSLVAAGVSSSCPRIPSVFQQRYMSSEARRHPVRVKRAVSIVLLEQIDTLGYKGEEITVSPGYARNFLIPYRKAVYATQRNRTSYKITLSSDEIKQKIEERSRNRLVSRIKDVVLRFQRATSDGTNLYSGVTAADVIEQIESTPLQNLRLTERNIKIGNGPAGSVRHGGGVLSTVGKHTIQVEPARYSPGLWAPMTIEIVTG